MSRFLFNRAVLLSFAFALSACTARDQTRVTDAVTSPLNDLNLIQTGIPAVLTKAQNQPYAIPTEISCNSLATEIQDLDSALGPDIDTPALSPILTLLRVERTQRKILRLARFKAPPRVLFHSVGGSES